MIFWYPYRFDDRWRERNEAKTDYVEGGISTSIVQAERSVINRVQCDSVRTAALSHSPRFLLTTSVLKQREVPATVSSFYVSVLYTAMLRTSIAAVVIGLSLIHI